MSLKIVKQSVEALIEHKEYPASKKRKTYQTISTLNRSFHVKTQGNQFEFHLNEPRKLSQTDRLPNPAEYILGTLGTCQVLTYQALATLKGIRLKNLRVEAFGEIDLEGFLESNQNSQPGFQKIRFDTLIESDESPEKLITLSKQVEKLCPILDNTNHKVSIQGSLTLTKPEALVS